MEGAIARINEVSSSWGYKLYSFGERLRYETESDPAGFNLKVTLTLLTMSAMNAVEPVGYSSGYNPSVVTKESFSGLGTLKFTAATVAREGTNVFKHSFKYADRVRMRAIQDPVSHNFPYSFDDVILSTNPILKNNGYRMFQQSGTMNGKDGVFEIGLTKDGIIDHRFFRPIK